MRDMTLRVMKLTEDSPANIAGFRVGDHIIKVTLLPLSLKPIGTENNSYQSVSVVVLCVSVAAVSLIYD